MKTRTAHQVRESLSAAPRPLLLHVLPEEHFQARRIAGADSGHVTAQAHIQLDRTLFGSRYGSGKWFAFLGKHVVNDLIQLHLKIHAAKV